MSAMYLMAAGHLHLTMSSIWRAWLVTNGYAAVVAAANWMLGTNFGYLAAKPTQPSVLDYLGPWPWYILGMEVLALVLFFLSFSVSRIADQLAQPPPGFKG